MSEAYEMSRAMFLHMLSEFDKDLKNPDDVWIEETNTILVYTIRDKDFIVVVSRTNNDITYMVQDA